LAAAMFFSSLGIQAQAPLPNNVQAISAPLNAPAEVAYDAAGNLYIADLNDHVIRKVDLAGIVTTFAGTGEQGFAGDGGAATSALLDSPAGVAIDAAGNFYIADTHNNRIREVRGGTISTIAGTGEAGFSGDGGSAVLAALNHPTALAVDAGGNLLIADTDNHRIRKISGTTITTVAGSGEQFFSGDGGSATAAGLDSPDGVAVDAAGNLYIGDTHNQRVRVVNPAGTITTLAGNGSSAYSGDGGPATGASLARPRGLSVDAAGNIYFADSDNERIRLIAKTGTITTVAGSGSQGFAGDGGPATSAELDTPRSPAVQGAAGFAFSDTHNQVVRQVGMDGSVHTIAGTGGGAASTGESLALAGASTIAYGSGSLTATFHNGAQSATGTVSLLDIASGSTVLASAGFSGNAATLSTSGLAAGTHSLVASYGGDAQNAAITSGVFVLTVTPLPVTAMAAGISIEYGQALPAISGTLTGVLPQDSGKVTAIFSAAATAISPTGQYPITVTLAGPAAGNYTVTLASGSGSLIIGKAATTVTLSSSNPAPFLGAPVTLTAQVASTTSGTPTGSVAFTDGTVLLASVPLGAGDTASYTSAALSSGAHSITAVYSGDSNFTGSSSTAAVETVAPAPDFTFTATGGMAQTVNPGQTATYTFALQSQNGFSSPITLAASGLPAGASAVFTPATVNLSSGAASFSLAIHTAALTAGKTPVSLPMQSPLLPVAAAALLLPLFRIRRFRASLRNAPRTLFSGVLLLIAGAAVLGVTGCGGGFFAQSPRTYTVTVTATAAGPGNTTLAHTTTVTLIVE
ncbi:MAG TPA: Ig-like domain repeat protein, partial [Acidobacteriaceae bacterium]|nr:Ig-like domain repeat protein [Acidobacteriaceae bacterium]